MRCRRRLPPLPRILHSAAAAVSLLLGLATVGVWIGCRSVAGGVRRDAQRAELQTLRSDWVGVHHGQVIWSSSVWNSPRVRGGETTYTWRREAETERAGQLAAGQTIRVLRFEVSRLAKGGYRWQRGAVPC